MVVGATWHINIHTRIRIYACASEFFLMTLDINKLARESKRTHLYDGQRTEQIHDALFWFSVLLVCVWSKRLRRLLKELPKDKNFDHTHCKLANLFLSSYWMLSIFNAISSWLNQHVFESLSLSPTCVAVISIAEQSAWNKNCSIF